MESLNLTLNSSKTVNHRIMKRVNDYFESFKIIIDTFLKICF